MAGKVEPYREPEAPATEAPPDVPCAKCKAPTDPRALTIAIDGRGMVCPACSLAARDALDQAGDRRAYSRGAVAAAWGLLRSFARRLLGQPY